MKHLIICFVIPIVMFCYVAGTNTDIRTSNTVGDEITLSNEVNRSVWNNVSWESKIDHAKKVYEGAKKSYPNSDILIIIYDQNRNRLGDVWNGKITINKLK